MKIYLAISSLSEIGGAEKVITTIANYWSEKGWNITLVTFDDGARPSFYVLSPHIKYLALSTIRKSSGGLLAYLGNLRSVIALHKHIKRDRPDVIISFLTSVNIITLLAAIKTKAPVIVSERNAPSSATVHPVRQLLRKWLYPRAKAVVCQTKDMKDFFPDTMNTVVIPNPVKLDDSSNLKVNINLPESNLLFAVGSMSKTKVHQKGFDLLLPVFSSLTQKHKNWTLIILGDGTERQLLINKVQELGLNGKVILPGTVNNIQAVLSEGDLFVLSSRYEGFPNALCEAMACGLPAVSFNCPTGPAEIIRDGIDGILVAREDTGALYKALNMMMSSELKRNEMGIRAREIVERYSTGKVMGLWENLLS